MSYITSASTVIITFVFMNSITSYSQDYMYYPPKNYTKLLELKQGYIQGVVVSPDKRNGILTRVEHYRGIPYAAPPIGDLRFMPPSGAPSWEGIKYADTFGPVCPQMFPDTSDMAPRRLKEFLRLKNYLNHQSEDCLYLNVYVPHNREYHLCIMTLPKIALCTLLRFSEYSVFFFISAGILIESIYEYPDLFFSETKLQFFYV